MAVQNIYYYYCILIVICLCGFQGFGQSTKIDSLNHQVSNNIYLEQRADSARKASFNAYPYVFYTPESKFAGGAGGIFVFYSDQSEDLKPSKIGFGGYYSSNKQYKVSMNNSFYFKNNKININLPISYGYFVNKFWGIGNETPKYDSSQYTNTTFSTTFIFQLPPLVFYADRTGIIIDYDHTRIDDKLDNELLKTDSVIGSNGAEIWGLGTDLLWDNRDNIFFPNKGGYQYLSVVYYLGNHDTKYFKFELDARHYFAIKKDHVIAVNVFIQSTTGSTPFYKLPAIGGKQMRGYFYGRYRDNFYGMAQVEYRQYFSKRWGFVVFGTLGNVSENILDYTLNDPKYSFGSGLRFLFNEKEKINLRADIGIGIDGSMGIYFGIEEAF